MASGSGVKDYNVVVIFFYGIDELSETHCLIDPRNSREYFRQEGLGGLVHLLVLKPSQGGHFYIVRVDFGVDFHSEKFINSNYLSGFLTIELLVKGIT